MCHNICSLHQGYLVLQTALLTCLDVIVIALCSVSLLLTATTTRRAIKLGRVSHAYMLIYSCHDSASAGISSCSCSCPVSVKKTLSIYFGIQTLYLADLIGSLQVENRVCDLCPLRPQNSTSSHGSCVYKTA